jgi:uncharacterized repeat protein (TIGR01451 family)
VGGGGDSRLPNPPTPGTAGGCTADDTGLGCAIDIDTASPLLKLRKTDNTLTYTAGGQTTYVLTVSNTGPVSTGTTLVTVVDVLPTGMTVNGGNAAALTLASNPGNWTCNSAAVSLGTQAITCTTTTAIVATTGTSVFSFLVDIATGTTGSLTNKGQVGGGGDSRLPNPPTPGTAGGCTADDTGLGCAIDIDTASLPAIISGYVWLNRTATNKIHNTDTIPLQGWIVNVTPVGGGTTLTSPPTGSDGYYSIQVAPGVTYQLQFVNPATNRAWPGPTVVESNCGSCSAGSNAITGVTGPAGGGTVNNLNLPIDPSGVVYDSRTGAPISGATVTLSAPGLTGAYVAGGSLSYVTGSDGSYQFFFLPGAPTNVTYTLSVTAPNYLPVSTVSASTVIPPCSNALNVYSGSSYPDPSKIQDANWSASRLSLPRQVSCPADNSGFVAGAATTLYYLSFAVQGSGRSNVINNHIPMDQSGTNIIFTKTTPLVTVSRGDLVPYMVTARNASASAIVGVDITDQIPPGFKFRTGSATLDGVVTEPTAAGRFLTWPNQTFAPSPAFKTLKMLLVVGTGVGDGLYTNSVWGTQGGVVISNIATATVRVVPDPTFDCPDVIGKVFDDKNGNGYQDQGEPGIPNVRMATPRGLLVTSDAEGRFHVPCPEIPNPDRGSNFFMKLDDRTLPSGYRLTTENPRDVRLTRGKLVKLNFGATIHRVVRIELTDAAFVPGKEDLLPEWQKKIEALPRQLTDKPSLIRLAYPPGGDPDLTKKRIDALKKQIEKRWQDLNCCYRLVIETEGE